MRFFLRYLSPRSILLFSGRENEKESIASLSCSKERSSYRKEVTEHARIRIEYPLDRILPHDKKGRSISIVIACHGADGEPFRPNPFRDRVELAFRIPSTFQIRLWN